MAQTQSKPPAANYCVDCALYEAPGICTHDPHEIEVVNLVTGESHMANFHLAAHQRASEHAELCGPGGQFWVAKPETAATPAENASDDADSAGGTVAGSEPATEQPSAEATSAEATSAETGGETGTTDTGDTTPDRSSGRSRRSY